MLSFYHIFILDSENEKGRLRDKLARVEEKKKHDEAMSAAPKDVLVSPTVCGTWIAKNRTRPSSSSPCWGGISIPCLSGGFRYFHLG